MGVGQVQFLPLSFDIVLAIMPLFYFGYKLDYWDIKQHSLRKVIFSMVLWGICFAFSWTICGKSLDFVFRSYPLQHGSFIVAIMGIITIIELSFIISKFKKISRFLLYLGKRNFTMFFIHGIDMILISDIWWQISDNSFINMTDRVVCSLFCFILVSFFIEVVKKYIEKRKLKKEVQS